MALQSGVRVSIPGRGIARINWVRDGMAGITFIAGPSEGGSDVVQVSTLGEGSTQTDLTALSDEELRKRIEALREARRTVVQDRRAGRTGTPRERFAKKKSAIDKAAKLLAKLSDEERQLLLAQLRKEGGA